MVACAIFGCNVRSDRKKCDVPLFSIPKVVTREGEAHERLTRKRRKLWLSRINREGLNEETTKPWTRVCGRHFIAGSPAALYDESNVDWAPSLNLGYELVDCCYRSDDSTECRKTSDRKKCRLRDNSKNSDSTEEQSPLADDMPGGSASSSDENNPDWSPSLNLGYLVVECCYRNDDPEHHEIPNKKKLGTPIDRKTTEGQHRHTDDKIVPHQVEEDLPHSIQTSIVNSKHLCDAITQTDLSKNDLEDLEKECKHLRSKLLPRRKKILRSNFSEESVPESDGKMNFYSTLPNFPTLMT